MRVCLAILLCDPTGKFLEKGGCFLSNETVSGYNKRQKVATLLQAGLEVFLFLFPFMLLEDLAGVFRAVRDGVCVRNPNVDDAVSGV